MLMNRAERIADAMERSKTEKGIDGTATRLAWIMRERGFSEFVILDLVARTVRAGHVRMHVKSLQRPLAEGR